MMVSICFEHLVIDFIFDVRWQLRHTRSLSSISHHTNLMFSFGQVVHGNLLLSRFLFSLNFLASFSVFHGRHYVADLSINDSTSPIPRIREATRSGWNGSRASVFTHTQEFNWFSSDMTYRQSCTTTRITIDFGKNPPVNGSASPNALAVFAASDQSWHRQQTGFQQDRLLYEGL